ncbi:hypothetical protein CG002_02210 [Mesoplasma florum]|uniref:hypothetical protein n=1 Tax=Mesoplasma florum TaxID=2151 RepID=UPI000D08895E|nr:hypothetical protein [Mesoplasma florum]AVN65163.1 hypothetical protein CG002_02210 [Mesoplasma florum]
MTEIEYLLSLNYVECCEELIKKYGNVPGDYFLDEECTKKNNKITRGKEGLYIHHIDEDKAIMLSHPNFARMNPITFQKAERLVYCNLLEHLVLHIKIFEFPNKNKNKNESVGVGGIYNFIVPELNDIYAGIQYKQVWKQEVIRTVLPLKDDYFKCIKKLINLNFRYPLCTSFIYNSHIWNEKNNKKIYKDLKKLGVNC